MNEQAGPIAVGRGRPTLPVNRIRPAYEQVADQLRDLIVQGALAPGDRLPVEPELAATFGVGRGTVREALRVLSSRNLIYSTRGATGGSFVAETDPAAISEYLETGIGLLSGNNRIRLDELLEARHLLEVPAARLAAQRRSPAHLDAIRTALMDEMAETESGVRHHHHRRFHVMILAAAGNRLLEVMTLPIFGVIRNRFVIQPSRQSQEPPLDFWRDVDSDHEEILRAITEGDSEAAATAMFEHLLRLNATYAKAAQDTASAS